MMLESAIPPNKHYNNNKNNIDITYNNSEKKVNYTANNGVARAAEKRRPNA